MAASGELLALLLLCFPVRSADVAPPTHQDRAAGRRVAAGHGEQHLAPAAHHQPVVPWRLRGPHRSEPGGERHPGVRGPHQDAHGEGAPACVQCSAASTRLVYAPGAICPPPIYPGLLILSGPDSRHGPESRADADPQQGVKLKRLMQYFKNCSAPELSESA
jgi:hypothetical protein